MIENSIEELFKAIDNSKEYKEYLEISNSLNNNKEVTSLIDEIKSLEKEATKLEFDGDSRYKEVDKKIQEKISILNNNEEYKKYLFKLKEFNNTLKASSSLLEDYVDGKILV
jgi:cell fate (sporulation/competence/biofilm development) regulator YlbF (YheA/YmcA/DUF963 family)